ncbi:hypothetical protein SAMN02745166_00830 [Prosthecobacter debontii]|uniref:Uncharacterized protein n=1 Tax=Prosthecobacter debontii TaxID=48467 RepID=A0A1T4WWZ2_9BACT|nr:hypothetical protein [Prosthecobacter debontii]SKA81892.1 hypothetical protein SAMN02745166_00830 [Prosthecobacter debontii]
MTKNQIHEWHERLEDGRKQYIRAYWNSREWTFRLAHPDQEAWGPLPSTPELWLKLHDVLFRKYQRKKLPLKHVLSVEKVLEKLGIPLPSQSDSAEDED